MGGLLSAGLATEVVVQAILCFAAAALGVVGAVRAAQHPARSEAEPLAGVLLTALVAVLISGILWLGWDPADAEALKRRAVSHGAAVFLLPMLALPAVFVAAGALGWRGLRGPRRWGLGAWVAMPALGVAACIGGAGVTQPDAVFAALRAAVVLVVAVPLVVASARSDEEGPTLRALALGLLVLVTAGLEACHGGLVTLMTIAQADALTTNTWTQGLDAFEAIVATARVASWGAVALASLACVASLAAARRRPQVAGILCVLLALAILGLSRPPRERMERLGVLCPPAPAEGAPATSR